MPGGRTNIVEPLSTLFGREHSLERLESLLADNRIVTIVGPGGMGKTRLALAFAAGVKPSEFAGGVWFCDATHARSRDELCQVVASALSLVPTSADPVDDVAVALRSRGSTLLIIDNVEQVIDESALAIASWARGAPSVRCLVTSRERLRIDGERALELEPLSLDAAVALFVDRAEIVGEQNVIEAIVDKLDRIPLAIALAAAQTRIFDLRGLLARLENQLQFLDAGPRDAPARQRTLRATISWSWALLNEAERRALAECATFVGPFDLDAAEAIIGVPSPRAVVRSLVEKSLIQSDASPDGHRLTLYGSVREHARQALDALPDRGAVHTRHAQHFETLCGQTEVQALVAVRDNLLAAYEYGGGASTTLLNALGKIALLQGPLRSTLELFDETLGDEITTAEVAQAHLLRARLLGRHGRATDARADCQSALHFATESGSAIDRAHALGEWAGLCRHGGEPDRAEAMYSDALDAYDAADDRSGSARMLAGWGGLAYERGDVVQARSRLEKSLALHEALGNAVDTAMGTQNLGLLLQEKGDLEEAHDRFTAAQTTHERLGNVRFAGIAAFDLGGLRLEQGDAERARAHLARALEIAIEVGDRRQEGLTLARGAIAQALLGQAGRAREGIGRARAVMEAIGDHAMAAVVEVHATHVAHLLNDPVEEPASAEPTDELRLANRLLAAARRPSEPAWQISRDGSWFKTPEGERVELSGKLASLLAALAQDREGVSARALSLAGWPDKSASGEAAKNRLQVALTRLRKTGLGCLVFNDGVYRLDPDRPVRIVHP